MAHEVSVESVLEIVKKIEHPEIAATFYELGMVGDITEEGGELSVEIRVPFPNIPIKDYLAGMIQSALQEEYPDISVSFSFTIMSEEVRNQFLAMARQQWKGEI